MISAFAVRWGLAALITLALYCGVRLPPAGDTRTSGDCLAVVVGAGDFSNDDTAGSLASDDARAVSAALGERFGAERVLTLTGSEATKNGLACAITSWLDSRESAGDTVVLYLAGHGSGESFGLYGFLSERPVELTAAELKAWLDELESRSVILIMDFCGCGDFGESLAGEGRSIITAGTGGETCWQDAAVGHGAFTYYFLEVLNHPESADTDRNKKLSVTELYTSIDGLLREHVVTFPPPAVQRPHLISDGNPVVLTIV